MTPGPAGHGPALPLLSGVLLALASPPATLLLPSFVALVPLLVYIADQEPTSRGRWAATRGGLMAGAVYFGLQLYWIAVALRRTSLLAVPAWMLTVAGLSMLVAAFALAVHLVRSRLGTPLAVAAACLWTAVEWLHGNLGDLSFPWLGLGTTLAPFHRIAGAADLVGALGLTTWLAAVNGLVASLLLRLRTHWSPASRGLRTWSAPALLGLTLVVTGTPIAYGFWRARTLPTRPAAHVAVVQPNMPQHVRQGAAAVDSSLAVLTALTPRIAGLHLVVWPEVALPLALDTAADTRTAVARASHRAGAPILTGAYGLLPDGGGQDEHGGLSGVGHGSLANAAFLVEDASAAEPTRYLKRRLVPFIERTPFGLAPLRGIGDALTSSPGGSLRYGDLQPGSRAPLLTAANGAPFGVLICFESIFSDLARSYRAEGAEILVNITNDAWYGDAGGLGRTTALWQHPAHMVLRAIETRAGVARAANTGFSLFVDPLGRVLDTSRPSTPAVLTHTVLTTDVTPLYVRWGDWLPDLAALLGLALVVAAALPGRDILPERRG